MYGIVRPLKSWNNHRRLGPKKTFQTPVLNKNTAVTIIFQKHSQFSLADLFDRIVEDWQKRNMRQNLIQRKFVDQLQKIA